MKNFPVLYPKDIFPKVEAFVSQIQDLYTVPVDIEEIVESLGIRVFPVSGLRESLGVEATTSGKLDKIFIDLEHYRDDKYYRRVRFSIAHELGHIVLHKDFAKSNPYGTIEEWKQFILRDNEREYGLLEYQANIFAGALLIPKDALISAVKEEKNRTSLARLFNVSEEVIQRRVCYEDVYSQIVDIIQSRH